MDAVLRAASMYAILMVIFRIAGRRTLSEMTNFDFVLLLVVGEATQQALLGDDFSMTKAVLVILTLVAIDVGLSLWKRRSPRLERWLEGMPTVIVEDGRPLREVMTWSRIDESDVLAAARESQGLERMEQIKYAVLERNGGISIIPKADSQS